MPSEPRIPPFRPLAPTPLSESDIATLLADKPTFDKNIRAALSTITTPDAQNFFLEHLFWALR
jgi:hypothetical protein